MDLVLVLGCLAVAPTPPVLAQSCGAPAPYLVPGGTASITGATSIALADFNNDGWLDMVIAAGATSGNVQVLLADGLGGFIAPPSPFAVLTGAFDVATGDFDRDGNVDIVVANRIPAGIVTVALGTGTGTFATTPTPALGEPLPKAVAVADFNHDGIEDIIVANEGSTNVSLLIGTGNLVSPFFNPAVSIPAGSASDDVVTGDFNRDGDVDVAVVSVADEVVQVLLGDGAGGFGAPTPFGVSLDPVSLAVGDFDKDGIEDLAVSASTARVVDVLIGNGTGAFAAPLVHPVGGLGGTQGLDVADFDGDGNLDVAVTRDAGNQLTVLQGDGTGNLPQQWSTFTGFGPVAVAAGDLDRDGWLDAAVANSAETKITTEINSLLRDCPNASFGPAARTYPANDVAFPSPISIDAGDLNGDGRIDLVTADDAYNKVTVLLGDASGGFGPTTFYDAGGVPLAVMLTDLNGDGFLDFVTAVLGPPDGVGVALGVGDGTFGVTTTVNTGGDPRHVAAGDFNGDGNMDVAVAQGTAEQVDILLGDGLGGFVPGVGLPLPPGSLPVSLAPAPANKDGRLDIFVADASGSMWLALGDGAGGFLAPTNTVLPGSAPTFVATGRFNADSDMDAIVADGIGLVWSLLGDGAGGFAIPASYPAGDAPHFVAARRLDGNTSLDLAVASNSEEVTILLGNGAGGFDPPLAVGVGTEPWSLVAVDLDRDGVADLAVANVISGNVSVATGRGDGTFNVAPAIVTPDITNTAVTGDFNRDGKPDVAVVSQTVFNELQIFLGDGAGGFVPGFNFGTDPGTKYLAAGDFNNDGRLDLASVSGSSNEFTIWLGDGLGTFVAGAPLPSIGINPVVVDTGDFDRDGNLDLVVPHGGGAGDIKVFLGDGMGGFAPSPWTGNGDRAAVGDYTSDGILDLAVTRGNNVAFYEGDGTGNFNLINSFTTNAAEIVAGDFNRDGNLDFATTDLNVGTVVIGLSDGAGGLIAPLTTFSVGFDTIGMTTGDFNHDGTLDLAVADETGNDVRILHGDGAGNFPTSKGFGAVGGLVSSVAAADFNRNDRLDLVLNAFSSAIAKGSKLSFLLNTNCAVRGLTVQTDVSACNTSGTPFFTQPVVEARDDGGNVIQCAQGPVSASIVPGTGTIGATLSGTNPESLISGVAAYTDLSIDLPGRRYRLAFDHPSFASALSRSFSQDIVVAISGPASVCLGDTPLYVGGGDYGAYEWKLDAATVSTLPNTTLTGLTAGPHVLDLSVTQDTCPASDTLNFTVFAPLSLVNISATPPTTVCDTCFGGTATVVDTDGGAGTHQWYYRTFSGGPNIIIPGATGSDYVINGADFPAPGGYFLVEETTPACGAPMVSNEVDVAVVASSSEVQVLAVTSRSTENVVQWVNPAAGGYVTTEIWYRFTPMSSACVFPAVRGDGTLLIAQSAGLGAKDSFTHGALPNDNTTYCYAAFVQTDLVPTYSAGRFARGRPFDTTGPVKWAYSTGATAVAASAIGPGVVSVSNDRIVHSMVRGAAGGVWPASWLPLALNGPAQSRPPVVPTSAIPGATQVAFVGSQDGTAYAVNAATGAQLWQSGILGAMIQASPSGLFTRFGSAFDLLFVGTRNSVAPNQMHVLNVVDGSPVGAPFDNAGGATSIGIISGPATVDYASNRIYFASRAGGSPSTLWALDVNAGGVSLAWDTAVGDIDGAATLRAGLVYAGTNTGDVVSVDAAAGGAPGWTFSTGDGAVKGFVFTDFTSTNMYVSTTTKVWGLSEGSASPNWPEVTLPGPSIPLFARASNTLLVGGNDGKLYQLDLAAADAVTQPAVTFVVLGDGLAATGAPSYDFPNNMIYVGSDAGIIYGVQLPLP